jgi:predicted dithiol-disulfide oxidoreductase (DUF899 family)
MSHAVVSQSEWLKARKTLLAKEKEFSKARDRLSASRRDLPWVKVEKNYVFDGPAGKETLADLFAGMSQLMIYHLMLGPGGVQGCPSRSFLADHRRQYPSGTTRRQPSGGVVCAACRNRGLPTAYGLEVQMGVVIRQRLQP